MRRLPDGSSCARYDPGCAKPTSLGSTTEHEPRAPEAGTFFEALAHSLARNAQMRYDGGAGHGALRGMLVRADGGAGAGGTQTQRLSQLVELWQPSGRCMVLLVGVAVFVAIVAFGGALALFASSSAASEVDATSPPPSASCTACLSALRVLTGALERVCPCISRAVERATERYCARCCVRGARYSAARTRSSSAATRGTKHPESAHATRHRAPSCSTYATAIRTEGFARADLCRC
jgi:hypothetical protein